MSIDRKKYWNSILYLCRELDGKVRGKKKLAKLLYFIDFDSFEKNEAPITGDVYKALPMGPFPISLEEITDEMAEKGMLAVEPIVERADYNPTETYSCLVDPDLSVFNDEEKKILSRVIAKYGRLNGKELEELSHAEAPYVGTELKEEIPYELAYYRGTDFAES